jgi:glycosyltransferase involved in cell wall biosynthesis
MTASRNPLVSILTPSFNQGRWLADNLDSVATQTYELTEHIVVDGGSTDDSLNVLRRHAGPRVSWRSEPDRGQSDAINKAFGLARGEIIGWLNSDDAYFSRETVAMVVDAFQRHPEADVVYGHAALADAEGLILQVLWTPPLWARVLHIHGFIVQPTAFIRRRVLGDHLVNPDFESMMDAELWLRLSERHRFVRLNRILAIDRHQPDRKTIARPDLAVSDKIRLEAIRDMPSGPWVRPTRKLLKVAFRLAGLTRVREAINTELAYAGRVDRFVSLVIRQVAMPRSRMPLSPGPQGPDSGPMDAS